MFHDHPAVTIVTIAADAVRRMCESLVRLRMRVNEYIAADDLF